MHFKTLDQSRSLVKTGPSDYGQSFFSLRWTLGASRSTVPGRVSREAKRPPSEAIKAISARNSHSPGEISGAPEKCEESSGSKGALIWAWMPWIKACVWSRADSGSPIAFVTPAAAASDMRVSPMPMGLEAGRSRCQRERAASIAMYAARRNSERATSRCARRSSRSNSCDVIPLVSARSRQIRMPPERLSTKLSAPSRAARHCRPREQPGPRWHLPRRSSQRSGTPGAALARGAPLALRKRGGEPRPLGGRSLCAPLPWTGVYDGASRGHPEENP